MARDKDQISRLAYNERLPGGQENITLGHTKGIILADQDGGFWATGTIPGFPGTENTYTYPENGKTRAEFFSCITMRLGDLNEVGTALVYRQAQIYGARILPSMERSLPKLVSAINGNQTAKSPFYVIQPLRSRAGLPVNSYSKSREFNGDLYKDLLATRTFFNFKVRSAISDGDGLPSDCTYPRVENILTVYIKEAGITIRNNEDNSKWAISESLNGFCIGDMNRNESDKRRGGGATCIATSRAVYNTFQEIIRSVERC